MRICIEGNMGVGKSTLCSYLLGGSIHFAPEPKFGGFGSGFSIEIKYLLERYRLWREISNVHTGESLLNEYVLYDRSCWSSEVFWRVGTFLEDLSIDESKLIHEIWDTLRPNCSPPDCIVYLDAPVTTSLERVRLRGLDDAEVDIAYLARMKSEYEMWLMHQELTYKTPILRYDVSQDMTISEQQQFSQRVFRDLGKLFPDIQDSATPLPEFKYDFSTTLGGESLG